MIPVSGEHTTIEKIDFCSIITSVESPEVVASLPRILNLFPNQPNPLSSETKIAFRLPEPGHMELKIYGVSGRLVRTLVDGDRTAGLHDAVWDGLDDPGREVTPGVYFYRLTHTRSDDADHEAAGPACTGAGGDPVPTGPRPNPLTLDSAR